MPRPKRSRVRRMRSYPRRQYRRFRRGKAPLPVLPMLGLAVPLMEPITMVKDGRYEDAVNVSIGRFTGYNVWTKKWDFGLLTAGWTPILAGAFGHIIANKIGVNRQMKKIPFLGKYVQL